MGTFRKIGKTDCTAGCTYRRGCFGGGGGMCGATTSRVCKVGKKGILRFFSDWCCNGAGGW